MILNESKYHVRWTSTDKYGENPNYYNSKEVEASSKEDAIKKVRATIPKNQRAFDFVVSEVK